MNILIVDFSQMVHRVCGHIIANNESLDKDDILKPIFASLHKLKKNFNDIDEIVLAIDSPHSWRKDVYPYYKASRKTNRNKKAFDWSSFFKALDEVTEDFKNYYPAKVVKVYGAEGDDIIAVLSKKFTKEGHEVIIASSDKDFFQLRRFSKNISQWCLNNKDYIKYTDDILSLAEHVLKGDYEDGIPNIMSDDDTYVNEEKKTVRFKKAEYNKWSSMYYKDLLGMMLKSEHRKNFIRNVKLIDFNCIPKELRDSIINEYEASVGRSPKYRQWVINNKLADVI